MDRCCGTIFAQESEQQFIRRKSSRPVTILMDEVTTFRDYAEEVSVSQEELWQATIIISMILFQSSTKEKLYEAAEELQNIIDMHMKSFIYNMEDTLQGELRDDGNYAFEDYVWKKILQYGYYYYEHIVNMYEELLDMNDDSQEDFLLFLQHIIAYYTKRSPERDEEIHNIKIVFEQILENAADK